MCVPTLQYSSGLEGQDFEWVHYCSTSLKEVSALAAAVSSDSFTVNEKVMEATRMYR
jgi:hypothetical protein